MSASRPRIAIVTSGRFWLLDLARELVAGGHDVTLYSMLPDARVEKFGIDQRHHRSLLPFMLPSLAWDRMTPKMASALRERWHNWSLNRAIIMRLAPCDILIGVSGLILEAAEYARRRFGARIVIERGSKHILTQRELLAKEAAAGPSDFAVARELAGYRLADRIVVPASHCAESFWRDPAAFAKLLVNPYGVHLEQFPRRPAPPMGPPTVVMVGGWQYRKGVDLLVEAMRQVPEARLLHVGGIADQPFPADPQFVHRKPVDQTELHTLYHQAHLFALASREEGLALVQVQAMACGLPIVCSDQTGGRDLALSSGLAERIDEVPVGDPAALAAAIRRRLTRIADLPEIAEIDRELLSWRRYANRYPALFDELLARS